MVAKVSGRAFKIGSSGVLRLVQKLGCWVANEPGGCRRETDGNMGVNLVPEQLASTAQQPGCAGPTRLRAQRPDSNPVARSATRLRAGVEVAAARQPGCPCACCPLRDEHGAHVGVANHTNANAAEAVETDAEW